MKTFQWMEDLDRRVLAAVRFVSDVDGAPIGGALSITADPSHTADPNEVLHLRVLRNRFGLHVLQFSPSFAEYCGAFDPVPASPSLETRTAHLRVTDPEGRYLPAAFEVHLPRAEPTVPPALGNVDVPVEVRLLPAPNAPLADGWAVLRVTVWREITAGIKVPLRGALIRLLRDDDGTTLVGQGLSEWRHRPDGSLATTAEALVAARGIPVVQFNPAAGGAVLSATQPVRVELRRMPALNLAAPDAFPDLAALLADVPPASVQTAALPIATTLPLHARLRGSCALTLTAAGELQLSQPLKT